MVKENEFQELMALAKEILENDTPYSRNRAVIDSLFNPKAILLPYEQIVYIRLSVIDSFYSTNMNMHIGGLENLANSIIEISTNDEELKIKIREYKEKLSQKEIANLFEGKYGKGQPAKARSLISKYFYFVMKHQFPIEDNLLKDYINEIAEYFNLDLDFHPHSKFDSKSNLIKLLLNFKDIDRKYDSFDNFVWLYGKIREQSFSLITNDAGSKKITKQNVSIKLKNFWNHCDKIRKQYEKSHPKQNENDDKEV